MSVPSSRKRRELPIEVLRYRDYRLLWAGSFISIFGTQMHAAALYWQIYQITGSAFQLGLLGLVRAIALICTSLIGGVVVDSRDRRKLMLRTQSILLFLSGSLALATWLDVVNVGMIYVVAAAVAVVSSFDQPARQAILPALVPREKLSSAMSLNILSSNVGMMVGPAVGGLAIATIGLAGTYAIDSLTFLGTITALLLMRTKFEIPVMRLKGFAAAREGLHFIKVTPVIYGVMLIDFSATLLGSMIGLAPIFVDRVFNSGPETYGLLLAAPAAGSVIGAAMMSLAPQVTRPGRVIIGAVVAYGLFLVLFGLSPSIWLAMGCLAGAGFSDAVSMTMRHTVRLLATPDALRGRVAATHSAFSAGGPRLGEFQAGMTASLIGPQGAMIFGGSAVILATLCIAKLVPHVRTYELSDGPQGPDAAGDTSTTERQTVAASD
ncbi:MAG: MFS transporter [Chloroflexia bacterium]|nr:MFS transporter [Chloroflexia bacterium]